jgi:hypothetical protein
VRIAKNILIKIKGFFVPVDFMVLDMQLDSIVSTANAHIDVGAGEIRFNINGKEE